MLYEFCFLEIKFCHRCNCAGLIVELQLFLLIIIAKIIVIIVLLILIETLGGWQKLASFLTSFFNKF